MNKRNNEKRKKLENLIISRVKHKTNVARAIRMCVKGVDTSGKHADDLHNWDFVG